MTEDLKPGGGSGTARHRIALLYFEGCPHVELARRNLRAALQESGGAPIWEEWDLAADGTPDRYRRHASPTILIDGEDVTGSEVTAAAMACRTGGAPTVTQIVRSLV